MMLSRSFSARVSGLVQTTRLFSRKREASGLTS
ncbi:hypothetical protein J3D56_002741 [Erwinia persicina]|nr:hypothetical protein [Erwinia persicina]